MSIYFHYIINVSTAESDRRSPFRVARHHPSPSQSPATSREAKATDKHKHIITPPPHASSSLAPTTCDLSHANESSPMSQNTVNTPTPPQPASVFTCLVVGIISTDIALHCERGMTRLASSRSMMLETRVAKCGSNRVASERRASENVHRHRRRAISNINISVTSGTRRYSSSNEGERRRWSGAAIRDSRFAFAFAIREPITVHSVHSVVRHSTPPVNSERRTFSPRLRARVSRRTGRQIDR